MIDGKHTPGEWSQGTSNEGSTCVWLHGIKEPSYQMGKDSEWIDCNTSDNAKLIADAGNTYNATGMTPSQLAEQREELLRGLKFAKEKRVELHNASDEYEFVNYAIIDDAIDKAEGRS